MDIFLGGCFCPHDGQNADETSLPQLMQREGMTEEYDNLDIIRETHRKLNEVRENYCQFQEADFSENPQPMCY